MAKTKKKAKKESKKESKKAPKKSKKKVLKRQARSGVVKEGDVRNYLKGLRKLDEDIVRGIRKNYRKGEGMTIASIHEIVRKKGYDVTYASVRNVCTRLTWNHVK